MIDKFDIVAKNFHDEYVEFAKEIYKAGLRRWYENGRNSKSAQQWIPCTPETMPKEPEPNPVFGNKPLELYLVTVRNSDYPFRAFWNGKSFTDGWGTVDVIAYMPLPAPYRPGDTHAP